MAAGACTTSRHIFGAANPFFSVLIISQAGKWAISPLPLPLFVAHLLGRNGRGKGKAEEEEGGDRLTGAVLYRSSICRRAGLRLFWTERATGEIRARACLWVDVGRGRERLVLRSFSEEVCSRDGRRAQLPGDEGFVSM